MGKRSILIVEDEPLIAMMLEDFLETLGHDVVGTCDSVEEAIEKVEAGGFDLAIIDVQLKDGQRVWPLADRLAKAGTPFIIATGGHVEPPPEAHAAAPILAKPYTIEAIEPALALACGG
jgi:CheY-like chemotaxis protein